MSKLKRKCLERDQLLAKLLLKLQKKRGFASEDEDDPHNHSTISSSVQQIEDLLKSDTNDEDDMASNYSIGNKGMCTLGKVQ